MSHCPICLTSYNIQNTNQCNNCGFDLTTNSIKLENIPSAYLEKEQKEIDSVQQMWHNYQNNLNKGKQQIAKAKELQKTKDEQLQQQVKQKQELEQKVQELKSKIQELEQVIKT